MKKNHEGTIKQIKQLNKNVYAIQIYALDVEEIQPGQYISILCAGLTFRRPFSVANFKDNLITILIKKRGKGTQNLINLENGSAIEFSGPLGKGFKVEKKRTLLVGAGIGVAPLFYLNKKLKEIGAQTYFTAGFASKDYVLDKNLDFISTDDGSMGSEGSICDYLEKIIVEFEPEKIVSCAPDPVLKFIAKVAKRQEIPSEVCMEKVMACGIGVCRGCVVKIKKGNYTFNKTICKDGPVFNGEEIVW